MSSVWGRVIMHSVKMVEMIIVGIIVNGVWDTSDVSCW